jgi:hypothetical protein
MTNKDAEEVAKDTAELRERLAQSEAASATTAGWSKDRWWPEVRAAHGRIKPNRIVFFIVRIILVGGAASLPVFATAGTLTTGHTWGWVTVVVSLVLALVVAFDQVYRPGPRWRSGYDDYHQLVNSAWLYLEDLEDGAVHPDAAYGQFVRTVEDIIERHRVEYLRDIANLNTSTGTQTSTIGTSRRPA